MSAEHPKHWLFDHEASSYVPTVRARSIRGPGLLQGSAVAALAARIAELRCQRTELHLGRLTIDPLRPAPETPLNAEAEIVRDTRRSTMLRVSIFAEEEPVCVAGALFLVPDTEGGSVKGFRRTPVAGPESVPPMNDLPSETFTAALDIRRVRRPGGALPAVVWYRMTDAILSSDEQTSVYARAAAIADLANAVSNADDSGLALINADITLYLSRPPEGEWLCLEALSRLGTDGVVVSACALHDLAGEVGRVAMVSLSTPPRWQFP